MGWTEHYTGAEMTWREAIDFMDEVYTWTNQYGNVAPIRSWLMPDPDGHDAAGRHYVYYAAVERECGTEREVWAGVALVILRPASIQFKDMDETVAPEHRHCPESILALLTPTSSTLAQQWRARVASQRLAARGAPSHTPAKPYPATAGQGFVAVGREFSLAGFRCWGLGIRRWPCTGSTFCREA